MSLFRGNQFLKKIKALRRRLTVAANELGMTGPIFFRILRGPLGGLQNHNSRGFPKIPFGQPVLRFETSQNISYQKGHPNLGGFGFLIVLGPIFFRSPGEVFSQGGARPATSKGIQEGVFCQKSF